MKVYNEIEAGVISKNITGQSNVTIHRNMTGPTDLIDFKYVSAQRYRIHSNIVEEAVNHIIQYNNVSFYRDGDKAYVRYCVWNDV